jgi:hypothetical protein
MGTGGCFPGGKAAGACSWPFTCIQCRGQEWWCYTCSPPYAVMTWCLINLAQRQH